MVNSCRRAFIISCFYTNMNSMLMCRSHSPSSWCKHLFSHSPLPQYKFPNYTMETVSTCWSDGEFFGESAGRLLCPGPGSPSASCRTANKKNRWIMFYDWAEFVSWWTSFISIQKRIPSLFFGAVYENPLMRYFVDSFRVWRLRHNLRVSFLVRLTLKQQAVKTLWEFPLN